MTIEGWIFLLSLFGAIGVPGAAFFAVFYSTLGPEKPAPVGSSEHDRVDG